MGPRHFSRGEIKQVTGFVVEQVASMGPRHFSPTPHGERGRFGTDAQSGRVVPMAVLYLACALVVRGPRLWRLVFLGYAVPCVFWSTTNAIETFG